MRDVRTDDATFRHQVTLLSTMVAYEAFRALPTATPAAGATTIDTPVASGVTVARVEEMVVLVPVLRSGLGMVPAIQALVPRTEVALIGLRRDEETLMPSVYLDGLPADLAGKWVAVCDPMLATGGSLAQACDMVLGRGAGPVMALSLIASAPGLAHFHQRHPGVTVVCVAVDPELDERGYIVPGLGDAGDRQFGPLHHGP